MDSMNTIIKLFADMCVEKGITLDEISQYFPAKYSDNNNSINTHYDCNVNISRMCDIDFDDITTVEFQLNDVITFSLSDGECVEAIVIDIDQVNHRVTFVFKNCFRDNCTYTDVDNFLISKYLMFPKSLRNVIDDDSFKLLSKEDVFSSCRYEYFDMIQNRITFIGSHPVMWWLDNKTSIMFDDDEYRLVRNDGQLGHFKADCPGGVRPKFTIVLTPDMYSN